MIFLIEISENMVWNAKRHQTQLRYISMQSVRKSFEAFSVWKSAQRLQNNYDDYLLSKLFNFLWFNNFCLGIVMKPSTLLWC